MAYEFIKDRLKEIGRTQKELADYLDIRPPHLSAIFKGIRAIQADEIAPMAKFLQINLEAFAKALSQNKNNLKVIPEPIKTIHKVGFVQAGKFNEACQLPENEWEAIPYPVNENYKKANIFALGVRGDSMNLVFPPEKTTLICCPLEDWLEANPGTDIEGKYIIAYRHTPDGLCEATVKKYTKIDDSTIILVAESTNPEIKPIVLHPDSNEYEIAAVVIGDMRVY